MLLDESMHAYIILQDRFITGLLEKYLLIINYQIKVDESES